MNQIFSTPIFDQIKSIYTKLELDSPLVFSHNDLNSTNFLLNPETDNLHLIDFEYSGFNKRAFEFGNLFNELIVNYEVDHDPYFQVSAKNYLKEE